jgi:hypothetical protein
LADILAGTIFIGFGGAFAVATLAGYDIGTPFAMGPGFFPLMLGGLLVALGILVVGSGFVAERAEGLGIVPWRAIVLLPIAFIVFGLSVRNLGVVPALFVTTLLAAFASERMRVFSGLVIAVGLTVASVLIFIVALQLRLPLFGPWLDFLGL